MHAARFDRLTRMVSSLSSRRALMRALSAVSAIAALPAPDILAAKSVGKTKQKKPKLQRNQYGCVAVGGACRGRDRHCCSGRCQGKKPKRGRADKSHCVAHHAGTIEDGSRGCLPGDDSYGPGETLCTTNAGEEFAQCWLTTGDAGYCGFGAACIPGGCRKDADCLAPCGAGAACVVLPDYCQGIDTVCFGIEGCADP